MPTTWTDRAKDIPTYDNSNHTYNDPSMFYDMTTMINYSSRSKPATGWTNRVQPSTSSIVVGNPIGLLLALTYATSHGGGSTTWTDRTKP